MDGQRFNFLEAGLWKDFIFNCNVYLGSAPKSSLGTESQYGWSAQTKCLVAHFLEFLPFSLGGKVLGDFEMLGLRFSFWEETMSCFQVKSKYLNTKTQFWPVEIWIVSECASGEKIARLRLPSSPSPVGAPFPHSLGSKCKDFVWWRFERHFQDILSHFLAQHCLQWKR